VIRVANSRDTFTKLEEMQYRAAARAAKRTGAAVITSGAHFALKQLDILNSEKLDPSRIIISHLDSKDCMDLERDKKIARSGAFVAYDLIGIEDWSSLSCRMPDEMRVELVQTMIEAKLQHQILLSTNAKCQVLGRGETSLQNVTHMLRYFIPKLKRAGVSDKAISEIIIDNPKRVLPMQ
jgi:predicted metal-dependent phosphotriesterase family hydrolase